jgi:hypothetical protein
MIAYKIMIRDRGNVKTLFHGVNGSKTIPMNEWVEADVKQGRDGSGDRYYLTGWHTLESKQEALDYLKRFKAEKDYCIVKCTIKDIWKKEHSPSNVYLSRYIKIENILE